MAQMASSSATTQPSISVSLRWGPADGQVWATAAGRLEHWSGRATGDAQRRVLDGGRPTRGLAKIESDIDACEVILALAPETNGDVAVKAWGAGATDRPRRTHLALPRDEKIRFRDAGPAAQDHQRRSGPARKRDRLLQRRLHQRPRADSLAHLTGRQQFYQDHLDARLRRGTLCVYRPPVDLKTTGKGNKAERPGDRAQLHHPAPEVGHPLHLLRQPADADPEPRRPGGLAEKTTRRRPAWSTTTGSRAFNINGALAACGGVAASSARGHCS